MIDDFFVVEYMYVHHLYISGCVPMYIFTTMMQQCKFDTWQPNNHPLDDMWQQLGFEIYVNDLKQNSPSTSCHVVTQQ